MDCYVRKIIISVITERGRSESVEDGTALAILIFVIGAALVGFSIGLSF